MSDTSAPNPSPQPETPPAAPPSPSALPPAPGKDEKLYAMLCHLAGLGGYVIPAFGGVIGPLIVWLIKKDEYPLVDDQGKESLNFQITMTIAFVVSAALCFLCVGYFLLAAAAIADLVFVIIASVKANEGVKYRYPLTIRFIK